MAHDNLTKAGFGERVTYYTGEALKSLDQIEVQQKKFDFIFIDADKENYPNYLERSLRLANPGALIVADNVLQSGRVYDASHDDLRTENMRAFNLRMANDPNLDSIILPVGQGLSIGRVKG